MDKFDYCLFCFDFVQVVTVTWLPVAQSIDYSPCAYYVTPGNARQISCERDAASQVLEAFRRNGNFADIDEVYLWFIDDLTDDDLAEILNIVASSASHQVSRISCLSFPSWKRYRKLFRNSPA